MNTASKRNIIHEQLIKNNYPRTLINRLFQLYIDQANHRQEQQPSASITEIPNTNDHQTSTSIQQFQPTSTSVVEPVIQSAAPSSVPPFVHSFVQSPVAAQSAAQPEAPPLVHSTVQSPSNTAQPAIQVATPPLIQLPVHSLVQSSPSHSSARSSIHRPDGSITTMPPYAPIDDSPVPPSDSPQVSNPEISVSHNSSISRLNLPTEQSTTTNDRESRLYRSIPYVAGLSERIIQILNKDYNNIMIACRQHNTIKKFHTVVKDPTNKFDRSKIVYKIPCSNCQHCYIGMTQNRLQTRLYGHKTHINKLDRLRELGYTNEDNEMRALREKTALIEHCIDHQHHFDFNRTEIVDSSSHTSTLTFLEMCHIANTPHTVNHRTDISGLNSTYAAILQTIGETFQAL